MIKLKIELSEAGVRDLCVMQASVVRNIWWPKVMKHAGLLSVIAYAPRKGQLCFETFALYPSLDKDHLQGGKVFAEAAGALYRQGYAPLAGIAMGFWNNAEDQYPVEGDPDSDFMSMCGDNAVYVLNDRLSSDWLKPERRGHRPPTFMNYAVHGHPNAGTSWAAVEENPYHAGGEFHLTAFFHGLRRAMQEAG